jgi:hypothetical protein
MFNKVFSSDNVSYIGMPQFYDVSSSTYLEPSRASVTVITYTSKLNEFDLFLDNPELVTPTTLGLIIKPRRVNKGALKEFLLHI